jgi:hypothetical protein
MMAAVSRCNLLTPQQDASTRASSDSPAPAPAPECEGSPSAARAPVHANERWRFLKHHATGNWQDNNKPRPLVRVTSSSKRLTAVLIEALKGRQLTRANSSAQFTRTEDGKVQDRDALFVPSAYKDVMKVAAERDALLRDARRYSPISLVLALNKLPQTIFARLVHFPIIWILFGTYGSVAALTRLGYIDLGDVDNAEIEGSSSVLVTFVVVFFVTFCYNRYFMIYDTARAASSTLLDCCVAARTCLPTNERRTLFIYLNLMHCSAYVALTPVYTKANFMDTFVKEHRIDLPEDQMEAAFGQLDSADGSGASAYQLCCVWCMSVLRRAAARGLPRHG